MNHFPYHMTRCGAAETENDCKCVLAVEEIMQQQIIWRRAYIVLDQGGDILVLYLGELYWLINCKYGAECSQSLEWIG